MIGRLSDETDDQGSPQGVELAGEDRETAKEDVHVREDRSSIRTLASQCIGSQIWVSLAEEVQALRGALEEVHAVSIDEDRASGSQDANLPLGRNSTFDFILCPPGSVFVIAGSGVELSEPLRIILCDLFCQNVDRVFKVFHTPTLRALVIQGMSYLRKDRMVPCNIALRATVYFAATTTLSTIQCQSLFGRSRADQLEHFRRIAEVAMTEANLLSTMDLATLQAFVMLITVTRSQDRSRRCWTLVAVAVRIARAIGLDQETSSYSPFETELRRRLWHQLRLLDVFCSVDRGTCPIILPSSFTTRLPSKVNDNDFDEHSPVITEICPQSITDTSLGLLSYQAIDVAQELVVTQDTIQDAEIWQRRMDMASRFYEHARDNYVQFCDAADPFHCLILAVAKTMVSSMMLRAIRPDQGDITLQQPRADDPRVLNIAVSCLKASEEVYTNPETQQWGWMIWIQWHALAVALSGLCAIREEDLVREAWVWVEAAFARYQSEIADAADGMLWTPMKKLYEKARAFRSESVVDSSAGATFSQNESSLLASGLALGDMLSPLHADADMLEQMMNEAVRMDRVVTG